MKIDFSTVVKGLDHKPLREPIPDSAVPNAMREVRLSTLCVNALMAPFPDEQNLDPAEKVKRFRLAVKVTDGGEVDLQAEEIADLKKLVGKAYGPLIVGRVYDLIDPEAPTTH